MSNYGMPYMGSKSGIIESIALNFPKADHFYDLFGGGFSVTDYMIRNRSGSYKYFHYNEINPSTVDLVKRAISGEFNPSRYKQKWVSREEFSSRIDDAAIRVIWSFGNNQKGYLFSKEIEPYKKSMHMAVVFGEFDDLAKKVLRLSSWPASVASMKARRYYLRQIIEHYRVTKIPTVLHKFLDPKQLQRLQQLQRLEQLERLQQLERLEQLQRLERLERLQQLERLELASLDYRKVEIHPNSVVYCDIPYKGTAGYLVEFSHNEFFDWAASRPVPVFISEYKIEDPRFKLVYSIPKKSSLSGGSSTQTEERLYWNGV